MLDISKTPVDFTVQRLCTWSGMLSIIMFTIGAVMADYIPPPGPDRTVEEVVQFFQTNPNIKRVGLTLIAIASIFSAVFVVQISIVMRQIESSYSHPLAWIQLLMAPMLIVESVLPAQLWLGCLYRPELDPLFTYRLNDVAWLFFVGVVGTFALQGAVIGVAILKDQRSTPLFPRWVAFYNFWVALLVMPGAMVPFFKSGPFAWNGLLSWWLVLAAFASWFVVMWVLIMKRSIPLLEQEQCAK